MDKTRKYIEAVCTECGTRYTQQKRVYDKAVFKDKCQSCRKHGKAKSGKTNECIDCGKSVWYPANRCKTCSNKARPQAKEPKHCAGCGKQISRQAKKWCLSCWNKEQDKGLSRARTKFNASPKWKEAREECFKRDNWTCQHCNTKGGVLNAHHIKGYRDYSELRLSLDNLKTLCEPCHKKYHKENGNGLKGIKQGDRKVKTITD